MKFIVSTQTLQKQLQLISGVIGTNTVLPILENFLFDIADGKLKLFATDLETSMITTLDVEAEEGGKFAIPARMLTDTLKNLPDQPLAFTINEEKKSVEVTSDNGKYKVSGEAGDDFPKMPEAEQVESVAMPAHVLLKAISSTMFATGTDELRPAMTGVYFELTPEGTNFVATDAHRLVRYRRDDIKAAEPHHLIVPKKALSLLKNALPDDETEVKVSFNQSNAFFAFGNMHLICRLIDAKYPDYNAVIPEHNPHKLAIAQADLLNSLRRVSIYANKSTYLIRIKITGSELQIFAEDVDFANQAQERLTCQYDGEDMEIGFNAKFLSEMLGTLNTDEVNLHLAAPTKAGVLEPAKQEDHENILMIVMPVMLNVSPPEEDAAAEESDKQAEEAPPKTQTTGASEEASPSKDDTGTPDDEPADKKEKEEQVGDN